MRSFTVAAVLALAVSACAQEETPSPVDSPGDEPSAKTRALEAGAQLLQSRAPLATLDAYLNGFHFYNGDLKAQVEAHHYCGHVNEDFIQCVIYDGDREDAKLMGVEYIVTRALFERLPTEEKHLWHSHVHEVLSGTLIAPGVPHPAEHELMEKIVATYGKTWHTWHAHRGDALPLGVPALMMGFTADGQLDPALLEARDHRYAVSSAEVRRRRADIDPPAIDPEADAWSKGAIVQLRRSDSD